MRKMYDVMRKNASCDLQWVALTMVRAATEFGSAVPPSGTARSHELVGVVPGILTDIIVNLCIPRWLLRVH